MKENYCLNICAALNVKYVNVKDIYRDAIITRTNFIHLRKFYKKG